MQKQATHLFCYVILIVLGCGAGAYGQSGQMSHGSAALGIHFIGGRQDAVPAKESFADAFPTIWDYFRYMPEDIACMSYADFWHWWHEFERYKGDEKGLDEMDAILRACLEGGMKVKIDLCHTTWWTNDKDWEKKIDLGHGPVDVDDWIHLCDLLGRRYRGQVALWHLQGEANDLEGFWEGAPIEHVAEIYRGGYRAFKRVDPGTLISISGATPSKSRESLDEWVRYHAKACLGFYDDIPMNFFADIKGADPYHGLTNYYSSIRKALDEVGQRDVEIGSGESSFQWAADSSEVKGAPPRWDPNYDVEKQPALSEEGQAWRCNESLGTFFRLGGTKFMFWGAEFAPGCGWSWRWGLRKYQDWWGIWPEGNKIAGTNIVARYESPEGKKFDLQPGWTSPAADPYHPIWQVYKYWAQASPPGGEAVRVPLTLSDTMNDIRALATYLRTQDRCVVLLQNEAQGAGEFHLDVTKTGWGAGTKLSIQAKNESINFLNGERQVNWQKNLNAEITKEGVDINLGSVSGFTTVTVGRDQPMWDAVSDRNAGIMAGEVGKPIEGVVVLRNTGTAVWKAKKIVLASEDSTLANWSCKLRDDVKPGERISLAVQFPAAEEKGYVTHFVRLREDGKQWFGPAIALSAMVKDLDSPRKLVAFREVGHVRLKWFAPERKKDGLMYEVYRADGFEKPFTFLAKVKGTEYIDEPPMRDQAYYYQVAAIDGEGEKSRFSNEDNAKALSSPRFWDAEIAEHTVPAQLRLGESRDVTITLRNTGSKTWEIGKADSAVQFYLVSTQLWGVQDEGRLSKIQLAGGANVEPGQTITRTVRYAGVRAGRFENHWILRMDVAGKGAAYFGTPLLVETTVYENGARP